MSFRGRDYVAVYNFAREQYLWHESTGRDFDIEAALIMQRCEEVIGQQPNFPLEARTRLAEIPSKRLAKLWENMSL